MHILLYICRPCHYWPACAFRSLVAQLAYVVYFGGLFSGSEMFYSIRILFIRISYCYFVYECVDENKYEYGLCSN